VNQTGPTGPVPDEVVAHEARRSRGQVVELAVPEVAQLPLVHAARCTDHRSSLLLRSSAAELGRLLNRAGNGIARIGPWLNVMASSTTTD
jgi:hypothetical protein